MSKNNDLQNGARADISAAQREQLADVAHVDLDIETEALVRMAGDELGRAQFSILRAGAYFIEIKARLAHGKFILQLDALGVGRRTAWEAMQIATYIASLPQDEARRLARIPPKKALALTHVEPDVVNELLEEGALDGDQPLSVRELRKKLKQLEKRANQSDHEARMAKLQAEGMEQERRGAQLAPWALAARSEAVIQGEAIANALDILSEVITKHLVEAPPSKDRAERARHQQAAAGTLHVTLALAVAKASVLADRLTEYFGAEVATVALERRFSPAEADRAEKRRLEVFQSARTDFSTRELERINGQRDGHAPHRGRPRTTLPSRTPRPRGRPRNGA